MEPRHIWNTSFGVGTPRNREPVTWACGCGMINWTSDKHCLICGVEIEEAWDPSDRFIMENQMLPHQVLALRLTPSGFEMIDDQKMRRRALSQDRVKRAKAKRLYQQHRARAKQEREWRKQEEKIHKEELDRAKQEHRHYEIPPPPHPGSEWWKDRTYEPSKDPGRVHDYPNIFEEDHFGWFQSWDDRIFYYKRPWPTRLAAQFAKFLQNLQAEHPDPGIYRWKGILIVFARDNYNQSFWHIVTEHDRDRAQLAQALNAHYRAH